MPALASAQNPTPADELRQYEVRVKDKPVGNVSLRMIQAADGTTTTWTDTAVEAEFMLIKYHYDFHSQETWNGDRLLQFASRTNNNGKPFSLQLTTDPRGSNIQTLGQAPRSGPPLAITENYWRLPNTAAASGEFFLIEPDNGNLRKAHLQFVGPDSIPVEGQQIACNHFRLAGDAAAELWFDNEGRMVRQQTVEQGYPTEERLVRIRYAAPQQAGGSASLAAYQN